MKDMTYEEARKLLGAVAQTVPDSLTCDDCFRLMSEYADAELLGREMPETLTAVRIHFSQCPCCAYEYVALLEAIRAAS